MYLSAERVAADASTESAEGNGRKQSPVIAIGAMACDAGRMAELPELLDDLVKDLCLREDGRSCRARPTEPFHIELAVHAPHVDVGLGIAQVFAGPSARDRSKQEGIG